MKSVAVIPAFNEEKTIGKIVRETKKIVDEVIVIDDGSKDKTYQIARKSGATLIRHKRNQGYGASLKDGIEKALRKKVDYIITLDSDGQHDPKYISDLIKELERCDVVIGSRFAGKTSKHTLKRNIALRLLAMEFFMFTGAFIKDVQSGYRGYKREILEGVKFREKGMGFSIEILIKLKKRGAKFKEVPIEVKYFKGAKSFFSVVKQGIEIGKTILKYF